MLCIGSYPRLTEQAGKQRYKDSADKGNAAARHRAEFYTYFGMKQLMAGGGIIVLGTTLIPLLSTLF